MRAIPKPTDIHLSAFRYGAETESSISLGGDWETSAFRSRISMYGSDSTAPLTANATQVIGDTAGGNGAACAPSRRSSALQRGHQTQLGS